MAVYLGRAGYPVDVFEIRGDPRAAGAGRGRSINLAISYRGLAALERVGLDKEVLAAAVAMPGRRTRSSPTQMPKAMVKRVILVPRLVMLRKKSVSPGPRWAASQRTRSMSMRSVFPATTRWASTRKRMAQATAMMVSVTSVPGRASGGTVLRTSETS